MLDLDSVKQAARAASGPRPYFLENPDCDRLLSMILAMGGQISALNEKLDSALRLLEQNNLLNRENLYKFEPDATAQAERLAWDEAFVTRLLRVLNYEFEAMKDSQKSTQYEKT
ncbi:hypothetical protein [Brevundimonas vesicularis]|uniref:hypothetical protein n=1 Tax=Brevundimonas vesicularis TaxID=41276 RepID=UPI0038D3AAB4